jgi:hypothetical protein
MNSFTLFTRLRTGQIGLVGASKLEAVDFEGHVCFLGGGQSPFVSEAEGAGSGDLPLPGGRESRSRAGLPVTSRSADPKRDAGDRCRFSVEKREA